MYEVFDHTADLGLRISAPTLPELFVEAARGLCSLMVEDLSSIQPVVSRTIELKNEDLEYLLFDWLNELLYASDTEHLVFSKFEAKLVGSTLSATAAGEKVDSTRRRLAHEVKAVTYHGLKVEHDESGWRAEVIVDI